MVQILLVLNYWHDEKNVFNLVKPDLWSFYDLWSHFRQYAEYLEALEIVYDTAGFIGLKVLTVKRKIWQNILKDKIILVPLSATRQLVKNKDWA